MPNDSPLEPSENSVPLDPPPRPPAASLLLAAIVDSAEDAIVSKNLDGIITSWNASAQRVFGYAPNEAIGRSILMLLPKDRKEEEVRILERMRRGERVEHFETIRVRKNGEHFPVSLTISPVRDQEGKIVGASKIARDITELRKLMSEREQLLESERAARAQAEHANRMKDEFLSTISHELRTPLNAIVGWVSVLKETNADPELTEGLQVIERNALAQAQLIEDLLDLGRISSGKMTLEVERVDIDSVADQAIASVRHAADSKKIAIKTIFNAGHVHLMGDRRRLQQVLWNLLSNAIKFTPKGGRVIVTVARLNSHIEVSVADNGRGIDPELLPHVFTKFWQADSTTTRQFGGLGIGLAIVKQLVELHGGEVRADSAGPGRGATFTVLLPIAATRRDLQITDLTAHHAPPAASSPGELRGIKVLAVDDDRDSLEIMRRILVSRQAEVKTAVSVEEALRVFATFHPHVLLSDIGMPGQDGYELARQLRRLPGGAAVPAAALTALARADDRMRALQAGFQTHVAKPVAPAELVAVVRSLAALHASSSNS